MKSLLLLIRWPNLLMLAGIQTLVFFRLLDWKSSVLSPVDLMMLVGVTVLIGAGGYIINDYYDAAIDQINRPDKWVAGNTWSLIRVRNYFLYVSLLGFIIATALAFRLHLLPYLVIYVLAVLGLWLYSSRLKCIAVAGNVWVSLFCAGVIVAVALPDLILDNEIVIKQGLWFYAVFAFLATWLREIVKDLQDMNGDKENHCNTAAVRWGEKWSKVIATIVALILSLVIGKWKSLLENEGLQLAFTVLTSALLCVVLFAWFSENSNRYKYQSMLVKFIMLMGTFLLLF